MRILRALSVVVLAMTGGLTGCFSTTRLVLKTQAPKVYQTATVEQVEKQVSDRDAAIKTLNAQVLITATTGGAKEGKVKEYTSFKGYIFVQKPEHLRVILQLPVIGSRALDMVSDGTHVHADDASCEPRRQVGAGNEQGDEAFEERAGESAAGRCFWIRCWCRGEAGGVCDADGVVAGVARGDAAQDGDG